MGEGRSDHHQTIFDSGSSHSPDRPQVTSREGTAENFSVVLASPPPQVVSGDFYHFNLLPEHNTGSPRRREKQNSWSSWSQQADQRYVQKTKFFLLRTI